MTTFIARRFDTDQPVKITLRRGRVASVLPIECPAAESLALPIVGPGLCDIQVNGYNGIWFSSETLTADEVETVIRAYLDQGITQCLPTLITNSAAAMEHGLMTIRAARDRSPLVRQVIAGCHIEGPWISPEDGPRGAHPLVHVRPADFSEFSRWQHVSGNLVRLVTLAPEVPNALTVIRQIARSGVLVSIGHTAATPEQIRAAIDAGATLGTHLGNGCAGMVPRHHNVFWPQLADDRLTCSIIADGWHVPATMLNCIVRCKSLDRLILTSDVSGFGGCPPGRYRTGDVEVDVLDDGRQVVAGQSQFLAGSGATTGTCVAGLMTMCKVSLPAAWQLASSKPASLIRTPTKFLLEGGPANLTVFRLTEVQRKAVGAEDPFRYDAVATIVNGCVVAGKTSQE
ncbi:MAG TPA: amidohydrolase family protein [Planctomycetaceae bacterium]|nr:amidohydrolase family protein [Planctomycetaceae bacterium]